MSVSSSAFAQITKEYEEKRNRALKDLAERRAEIYAKIPQVKECEGLIASLTVEQA
ncbi:MAG: DNA replication protein DnaC, partial [Parasporobacterium sp.]|nr:DNA replication protein DnaC [Parasporobacterium sp.]